MKQFTVYNKKTGEIRTSYSQQTDFTIDEIKNYLEKDEGYLEGWYTNQTHKVVDKLPVIKSTEIIFDLNEIRMVRNALLKNSDWTQNTDSPLPEQLKKAWLEYRKKLRDLPKDYSEAKSFEEVIFPEEPK